LTANPIQAICTMVRTKAKIDYCRLVPALELQMPTPTHGPPSPATKDHKCFGTTASMHGCSRAYIAVFHTVLHDD